ncbi:hypothetical protein MFUL124B02_17185 [Myxococcus fulvus 124B02]|nr:hypothetical protein MFUL124B02_17185 [Myxococcus fulvus 124B02]
MTTCCSKKDMALRTNHAKAAVLAAPRMKPRSRSMLRSSLSLPVARKRASSAPRA